MPRLISHPVGSQSYLPHHAGDSVGTGRLRTTSAFNLSIAAERTPQKTKLPLRTSSFQFDRGDVSTGSTIDYGSKLPENHALSYGESSKPIQYKAAEKGSGGILPTLSPRNGYVSDSIWNRKSRSIGSIDHNSKTMSQKLRRRTTSNGDFLNSSEHHRHNSRWSTSDYSLKNVKPPRMMRYSSFGMSKLKQIPLFQALVLCGACYLVVDSYFKAVSTTVRLERFKEDESMMMLHLQRIEQQSIHLHENMFRLTEVTGSIGATESVEQGSNADGGKTAGIDSNLIRVQTQQLHQMEEELDHELRALQNKLQHAARSSIIHTYGEGPVKIDLELDFPDETPGNGNNVVTIQLGYDTPHAAWTWLDQINKGEWNGSTFRVGRSTTINASPVISNAGTLNFIERSHNSREAWTVGLTDDEGNLGMFINLQDETEVRKHEVTVGKVVDGFDALQKLVEIVRSDSQRSVHIHRASAGHMTRPQRSISS